MLNTAWIGLIGALGGVAIGGVIGIANAAYGNRLEEATHLRDRADRLRDSRATLRRTAYTRFLVAAHAVADHFLAQPPAVSGATKDPREIEKRLRDLTSSGKALFAEYDTAKVEVELLAGEIVTPAFDGFIAWMRNQLVESVRVADALEARTFANLDSVRQPLVDAIKKEQEADPAVPATAAVRRRARRRR